MRPFRISAVALLLLLPCLSHAQVYRCVDKNGRVQYSQTKPRDADCAGVNTPAPPPSGANVGSPKPFTDEIDKSRAEEAQVRQQAEQQQAQKEARCGMARQRLVVLEQANKVFTIDEQGERHYQNDAQNDALREAARQSIAAECG